MKQKKAIFVRKAVPKDARELLELNKQYNGEEVISENILKIREMLGNNETETVFVAVCEDSLIGFACIQIYLSFCYRRPSIEITELFVEERMRRQNAATHLINEVLKFAVKENVLAINLRVNKTNRTAINFYKSIGLEEANHLVFRKRYF